jgi:hypothetical protein
MIMSVTVVMMMVVVMIMMVVVATMSKYPLRHTCSSKQQDCSGCNSNNANRFIHFVVVIT